MAVNWSLLFPYKLDACRRLLFPYWPILRSRCAAILCQHDVYYMAVYTACSVYTAASIFVGTNFIRDVLRQKRVTLDIRKLIMLSESSALVSPRFIRKIYNAYLYLCRGFSKFLEDLSISFVLIDLLSVLSLQLRG